MATGKERIAEVVDYSLLHGDEETINAFNIDKATLDRYKRGYRQHFGENADLLMKIKRLYTPEELVVLANGGRPVVQANEVPNISFSGDEYTLGVVADTHFGSAFTDDELFPSVLEEMDKQGCESIALPGDISEGMMARPNQIYELKDLGFEKQREVSKKRMEAWKKDWYIIDGNHDDSYNTKLGAGISMGKELANSMANVHYLGNGMGEFTINGIRITLFHGNDGGASYAISYRLQKIIESLASKKKPHILISGHDHKAFYLPMYRNVQSIASGSFQKQTPFMALKRSAAHTGFWILKFGMKDGSLLWFMPRWYPLYI